MVEGPWAPSRFLLWIDAVGGYLFCLKETVVLGHPRAGQEVDIPILGPIASVHAMLWRDQEGYWLQGLAPVRVNQRRVEEAIWLSDGCQIQLGSSVRLRFWLPHPCSLTARLEIVSAHRTEPRTDGVVLMAQSCVLGPETNCHILCPWLEKPVVLFRHQGGLCCRTEGWVELDGHRYENQTGLLSASSRLRLRYLCLGLESF